MPTPFTPTPPLPPVVQPQAPDARPAVPTVRDKAAHVLAGVGCGVGAVVTFWGATVAWDNALWALVAACSVATAGLGAGALWLLVWPIVVDVRHSLRDFDSRDNYGYAVTRFHQRQDKTLGMAANHLYTRAVREDTTKVNGKTRLERALEQIAQEQQALRTQVASMQQDVYAARYTPPADNGRVAIERSIMRYAAGDTQPLGAIAYTNDMREVVGAALHNGRVSSWAAWRDVGWKRARYDAVKDALLKAGVFCKQGWGKPFKLAADVQTHADAARKVG